MTGLGPWRKSSRSQGGAHNCVELAHGSWRKTSYSGGNGGACVEVARSAKIVAIRDSKNAAGPVLAFGQAELGRFLSAVKDGRFDG
ncbi:DUF397 domain-containing protein [Goodfellowiella coeruleoviolacea]|uniref:DUF397 domain-containing protein n=1 Tax=Goodfellowiella coeruleoviolacea TaxID=334858 RepID=A0AAE3KKE4_9PSEU|nr:DUF397 domain-containing protein [Goodfellowiella coeruleoviolacea]MCP2169279.1 protein of unknown function (DUF397) [Goodfellowiella coeruleoviolacea]